MSSAKCKLEIHKEGLTLGEKPFYLASGDMHYFRFFKEGWRRRLQLMKDFGLTAVQTYVPWNLHEPEKGEFHFEDRLDVASFLGLCQEMGLKVLFRPSGYICSEWDWGGLPYWLLKEPDLCIRTSDHRFMKYLRAYYTRLAREFVPYLSTRGGPIIAVAVENEYGSFGDDTAYIKAVGDLLAELGVDVPLYTANGVEPFKMIPGSRKEYWTAVDAHEYSQQMRQSCESYQPDKPMYIAEFWGGRSQQWGGYFKRQTPEEVAEKYKTLLEQGAYVNFYMFCGGTNFGFQNGALVGRYGADVPGAPNRYIPFATSYDVDAPVTEYGEATAKYDLCKKVLAEYLESRGIQSGIDNTEKGQLRVQTRQACATQAISHVALTQSADLLANASRLAFCVRQTGKPLNMEAMDQDYGFILYSTRVSYTDDARRQLSISGLHDRALVYGNGVYLGCCMRDRVMPPITFSVPRQGLQLDILVENMGRVNYGTAMLYEKKGILDFVRVELLEETGEAYPWNYTMKTGWTNYALPLKNLSALDYSLEARAGRPAFFAGSFSARPGIDTFLNMEGWNKGVVWINDFNLGRYWKIGPQGTLYVPGELLKAFNTIQVLELHNPKEDRSVAFDAAPSLDTIAKTTDLVTSVVG